MIACKLKNELMTSWLDDERTATLYSRCDFRDFYHI